MTFEEFKAYIFERNSFLNSDSGVITLKKAFDYVANGNSYYTWEDDMKSRLKECHTNFVKKEKKVSLNNLINIRVLQI